jgi:hypothetical protein
MSAISVAKNPMLHSRTKHLEVRYHFLRDNVVKGKIDLIQSSMSQPKSSLLIS